MINALHLPDSTQDTLMLDIDFVPYFQVKITSSILILNISLQEASMCAASSWTR